MNDKLKNGLQVFFDYFGMVMVFVYLLLGFGVLFSDFAKERFPGLLRPMLGIVLILYGLLRAYRDFRNIKDHRNINLFFLLFCTGLYCFSCNKLIRDPYANTPTSGRIRIAVDETYQPIMEAELTVFQALYRYSEIKPSYLPEKNAFELLLNDSVNFLLASRSLTEEEIKFFHSKQLFPRILVIATDAVAVIMNPVNKDTLLTVAQLKGIMTGQITKWKEINPSSKLNSITVVFDNQYSSTVRYARDSICSGAGLSASLTALSTNTEVINYVAQHIDALGIIGVCWISDHGDSTHLSFLHQIKVAALTSKNKATWENSFHPYQAYIFQKDYPLTRKIYAINTEPMTGLATGLTAFIAGEKGQRIILKSGIVPDNAPTRIVAVRNDDVLNQ